MTKDIQMGVSGHTTEHIYPTTSTAPNALEMTTPGAIVVRPLDECWLCQNGVCLQTQAENVIVHSRHSRILAR